MTDERDAVLLERVAAKDRGAFQELYQRYYQRLFGFIFKLTRRPEVVEEALNDTLLAVWKGAGSFGGRSRPSTWILGIAHRQALKALSRVRRAERDPEVGARRAPRRARRAWRRGARWRACSARPWRGCRPSSARWSS